jgi:membrane protein
MRATPASRSFLHIAKATIQDFSRDECGLRAAALCYYTIFALPPLLILLIRLAGVLSSPGAAQHALESQLDGLIGTTGAAAVGQMVSSGQATSHGTAAAILSAIALLAGATGAFLSLQQALNAIWEVGPDPKRGRARIFIIKRLLSLGMVVGVAFLLIASLAVTAAISAVGTALGGERVVMQIVNLLGSIAILSALFAAIFRFLPDAAVEWRSVWVGGVTTAVLFEAGKFAIGFYLGRSNPGTAFGAASALAVILVWIYYGGLLVLLGAEFTQHYAQARCHGIRPSKGAVRIERAERIVADTAADDQP